MSAKMREALHNILVTARPYASYDGIWPLVIRMAKEALAEQPAPAVPDGWKMVPVEPTMGMYDDWLAARKNQYGIAGWQAGYAAMLAAAPEPRP